MKCDGHININSGGALWRATCDLEEGHEGSHVFYGDNYKLTWLTQAKMIENYNHEVGLLSDEVKENCKRKLMVENLVESIF